MLTKMDGSSVLLDLRSVITMLTAQRSAGSHQPSISDTMRCQLMAYLQTETLSQLPRPCTDEFDVEIQPLSDGVGKSFSHPNLLLVFFVISLNLLLTRSRRRSLIFICKFTATFLFYISTTPSLVRSIYPLIIFH